MKSPQANYLIAMCVSTAMMLLLEGCASGTERDVVNEDRTARAETIRCPAGYVMICEAKKTGRIRFGRIGKDKLDSCACEPENTGRPARTVIPSIP